jgi:hypothetical protein
MKIHNIDLDVVELGTNKADGSIRFSMEISGLNNVSKIMAAFVAGKTGLESYKNKDLSILRLLSVAYDLFNVMKKGR